MPKGVSLAVIATSLATIASCATKDRAAARPDSTAVVTAPSAAAPALVTVHTKDFAFDTPTEIAAGMTTFRLVNDGPGLHHAQIVRLDSGKNVADLERALKVPGPLPRWAVLVGGPNAVDAQMDASATIDMAPGNYALVCLVDVPDGVPHFTKGMTHPLLVRAPTANTVATPGAAAGTMTPIATALQTDAVVTLADYNFAFSKPLTAGKHTIEVRVASSGQPHELALVQLAPGKTTKDFLNWMEKMQGPPPAHGVGGTAAAEPGRALYFTADLTPGDYVVLCFVPDAKDGKPHFMHGMIQTLKIS